MRLKSISAMLFTMLTLMMVSSVSAQGPSAQWVAWNAQITAHANSSQLDIAETQNISVTSGPLSGGERDYSQPVNIQSVYLAMNGGQPQQLSKGNGTSTYQISTTSSAEVLTYQLPAAANAGDTFTVLINYTVAEPTPGVIDWNIVPGTHGAPVASSTVTVNFPDGQAPTADFVRFPQGSGTVTTSGSSIVIKSQGAIPANQPFEIQIPYGSNVGAANSGNTGNTNPIPNNNGANQGNGNTVGNTSGTGGNSFLGVGLPGVGTICVILCIVGVLIILGGGGLLRGLIGGVGGSLLGGIFGGRSGGGGPFGGGGNSGGGGFFGGGGSGNAGGGRGFRESADQNREVPPVNNDKQSGGGASFH